jgi:RNA polymerase sigma-70 factor (ECF subfamily)
MKPDEREQLAHYELSVETLWNHMHSRLLLFIRRRIPDDEDAEDILQDVFVKIHTHLESVQSLDRLEGWIFQIARNCIADYYRGRRRLVELTDLPVEQQFLPEDASERLAPDIRELVDNLPEPYRKALVLNEYQGLNQRELAEELGISVSGAKSRIQRARQKIKDSLLSCCHFELDERGVVLDFRPRCCCCSNEPSPFEI